MNYLKKYSTKKNFLVSGVIVLILILVGLWLSISKHREITPIAPAPLPASKPEVNINDLEKQLQEVDAALEKL